MLQWGRDVTVADVSILSAAGNFVEVKLQWGRDVTVADVSLPVCETPQLLVRLQWGRDVTVADVSPPTCERAPRDRRFNGAATLPSRMCRREAQQRLARQTRASMGPRRYRRGCLQAALIFALTLARASMGPRRYRRGCQPVPVLWSQAPLTLQWGRDVTVADVEEGDVQPLLDVEPLQWGRDVTVADVGGSEQESPLCPTLASMGPRRYRRGCLTRTRSRTGLCSASMGPRRYRRGCQVEPEHVLVAAALQWGRDVTVADVVYEVDGQVFVVKLLQWGRDVTVADVNPFRVVCDCCDYASMGPRRYRRGCCGETGGPDRLNICFNGAATLPSRMWALAACVGAGGGGASMGPRRYRRGCGPGILCGPATSRRASMGPRRYRRGCPGCGDDRRIVIGASMGPRRYRRGCRQARTTSYAGCLASMGPRRYRRGCYSHAHLEVHMARRLQWGRDVTVADVGPATP